MPKNPKSFFERLTGSGQIRHEEEQEEKILKINEDDESAEPKEKQDWLEEDGEGQLTVDMHQTPANIVIQAMVAGVKLEDLDISITQDMITIKGSREKSREVSEDNYYYKELYWGSFSRSILLPQEVDTDNAGISEDKTM